MASWGSPKLTLKPPSGAKDKADWCQQQQLKGINGLSKESVHNLHEMFAKKTLAIPTSNVNNSVTKSKFWDRPIHTLQAAMEGCERKDDAIGHFDCKNNKREDKKNQAH